MEADHTPTPMACLSLESQVLTKSKLKKNTQLTFKVDQVQVPLTIELFLLFSNVLQWSLRATCRNSLKLLVTYFLNGYKNIDF